ncbi:hypothetical protein ASPWEDRAFT_42154 [Aspergillus wentii DTO 134E9]|uniref:Ig-like domain-containing protein n=1 Tax=Aspergillus wentii DTO 134E9 TaxID=1073089 RepID=A0A1L9RH12_ASPWE|nr:uncharacterized protein ASPWEDRAFT_42154 [Aspergillus wentii DTO 134E9]OJJ34221.1 hypothetical protein ASPWEDRAFT_42154 [Aspergillus wentii DTO 134E9]
MIGWVAFVLSLQGWLSETPAQKRNASTPGYMSVLMSCLSSPKPNSLQVKWLTARYRIQ